MLLPQQSTGLSSLGVKTPEVWEKVYEINNAVEIKTMCRTSNHSSFKSWKHWRDIMDSWWTESRRFDLDILCEVEKSIRGLKRYVFSISCLISWCAPLWRQWKFVQGRAVRMILFAESFSRDAGSQQHRACLMHVTAWLEQMTFPSFRDLSGWSCLPRTTGGPSELFLVLHLHVWKQFYVTHDVIEYSYWLKEECTLHHWKARAAARVLVEKLQID